MKVTDAIKRKIIQTAAFCFTNIHPGNFHRGTLYTGPWKRFCNPGLNCYSCPAASLACPIGAFQAVSGSMNYDFSFYVAGMLMAIGVLLGRFVCGWLCPFGLIQEVIHRIPSPKRKLWKGLLAVKYIILVVFVCILPITAVNYMGMGKPAFCQYICPSGTLLGGIPLLGTHPELRQTIGALFGMKLLILIFTVIGCVFIYRFFCKAICPLGAVYGVLNKISVYHLEVNAEKCVNCKACMKVCKMEVNPVRTPNSAECIRCGACVSSCPTKAIHIGFGSAAKSNVSPQQQEHGAKRLAALDAVRGLAVMGMYIQHFALNERNGDLVSGNTMILFILCSGISYSIMMQRMKEKGTDAKVMRTRILARSILIDFMGYILIMLNGPFAVVLPAYAMLFIMALVLQPCSKRTLITVSGILYLVCPPLMLIGLSLFSDAALLGDLAGGPLSALAWMPVFAAGMAIGRFDLQDKKLYGRFVVIGLAILIPAKLIASFVLPGLYETVTNWLLQLPSVTNTQIDPYAIWPYNTQPVLWHMLFLAMPQGGSMFELLIGTGLSFIIVGLVFLVERKCSAVLIPFCTVGRAALTLYVIQFVIAWGLGVAGIDVTSVNIGAAPYGDILIAAAVLGAGSMIALFPKVSLEILVRRFEKIFC